MIAKKCDKRYHYILSVLIITKKCDVSKGCSKLVNANKGTLALPVSSVANTNCGL